MVLFLCRTLRTLRKEVRLVGALSSNNVRGHFHLKTRDPRRLAALRLDLVRLVDGLDAVSSLVHQPEARLQNYSCLRLLARVTTVEGHVAVSLHVTISCKGGRG